MKILTIARIPADLKSSAQWVNWKLEIKNGSQTKIPYHPSGYMAKSTDRTTWSNIDEVLKVVDKFNGVGFVFTSDDPFVFIDLDHVLDVDTKRFKYEWAMSLYTETQGYWEISPSGDGLHGIVRGVVPDNIKNKSKKDDNSALEVYSHARYATFTGDIFEDNSEITKETISLLHLADYADTRDTIIPQTTSLIAEYGSVLSDDEVIQRMDAEGHWLVGVGQDGNSELDASFIAHLTFWCGGDEAQIERLARSNPLYRAKWDRKQSGGTFLTYLIKDWKNSGKAEYYTPPTNFTTDIPFEDMSLVERKKAIKSEKKAIKSEKKSKKADEDAQKAIEEIDNWLVENSAHVWFDEDTEKYCIKRKTHVNYFSKNSFMQFFLSHCDVKLKSGDIKIEALRSDYRPNKDEFFEQNGSRTINTFTSSELMNIEVGVKEVPMLIEKLLNNLFDDKKQMMQFINWLAFIYQKRERTQTAWVFAGKQGTGKGILVDYIIKGIWKHNAVCNLTDSHLESAFNPYLQDKLIVHFNEISADTKKSRVAVKNRLKTWLTDETVFINSKGIKEVERSNYCNIIMNSNEHIPIDIEAGDRRFNVVKTDGVLKEQDWFVGGGVTVKEIEKEIKDFASFLAGYEVDIKLAHSVVSSDLKEELIEAVKPISELIADAIIGKDFDFFLDCDIEKWLKNIDDFNKPNITQIENEFMSDFISNKALSILISAAFERETNMMSAARIIFRKHKIGEKAHNGRERGYKILRKNVSDSSEKVKLKRF